jgi:hypothetical protein
MNMRLKPVHAGTLHHGNRREKGTSQTLIKKVIENIIKIN